MSGRPQRTLSAACPDVEASESDTGRVIFAIDVRWTCAQPIETDADRSFAALFRPQDGEVCVWVDDQNPYALRVEFDVEADDYELAIREAQRQVRLAASQSGLLGTATEVVAMTDEGKPAGPSDQPRFG
jgi:hypothetical protein